jgi:uroporphyrin-III C-methyltransferase/precorrin-2 dehydrogenase/sirohydrochlorin ferrochelatase
MDGMQFDAKRHLVAPGGAGAVAIVGAGPGDPELLTLRALAFVQRADVIVYDRLVGAAILDLASANCRRIDAGKRKGGAVMTQAAINALLVRLARQGYAVVRLKGGDPFIFGRGGEERDYLKRAGIATRVVPGITAATGCAAASGIPLTHRDHAAAVTFISGHAAGTNDGFDWAGLARGDQTLVFYMALSTAGPTARRLIAKGRDPATPVAIIENGTLPTQRTILGTLGELEYLVHSNAVSAPALVIVGTVAALADASQHDAVAVALAL